MPDDETAASSPQIETSDDLTSDEDEPDLDLVQKEKIKELRKIYRYEHRKRWKACANPKSDFLVLDTVERRPEDRGVKFQAFLLGWPSIGFQLLRLSEFFHKVDKVLFPNYDPEEDQEEAEDPFRQADTMYWCDRAEAYSESFGKYIMGTYRREFEKLKTLMEEYDPTRAYERLKTSVDALEDAVEAEFIKVSYFEYIGNCARALRDGLEKVKRIDALARTEALQSKGSDQGATPGSFNISTRINNFRCPPETCYRPSNGGFHLDRL